jgi:hypothetical protein
MEETANNRVLRFEIADELLNDDAIKQILADLSRYTIELSEKHNIDIEKFRVIVGKSALEKILDL